MTRPVEFLRILVGQEWFGLAFALGLLLVSLLVLMSYPAAGVVLCAVSGTLLAGVAISRIRAARLAPAPGQIHSVNGIKAHILAEGERGKNCPVIWVPGGHGAGLIMQHLHGRLRGESRSILFDRTGSGWSGAARKPVTISGEVKQLRDLLECAKERGPFILAGHSFGGLFSANFAHHYPELVAGVILLDSTPPWNVAYVGKLSFSPVLRKAWLGALASHFGLQFLVEPEISDTDSALSKQLHEVRDLVNALSVQPRSLLAEASVFKSCMDNPLDLVIGKGALGDVPLVLMSASPTVEEQDQLRAEIKNMLGLTDFQADNLMHGLRDSADQQVALSSRGRHVPMPSGASHMFPYEYPDMVLEEVRKMQLSVADSLRRG